jgi:hypothetical protein
MTLTFGKTGLWIAATVITAAAAFAGDKVPAKTLRQNEW